MRQLGVRRTLRGALLLGALALFPEAALGQSLIGGEGLLFTPTALTAPDGTFTAGGGFVHRTTTTYYDGAYHFAPVYASLVFLPGVELGIRFSRAFRDAPEALGDRMLMAKWRPLAEGRLRPAVAIGAHDFLRSTGALTNHFHAGYLVASKHLRLGPLRRVGAHLGYGLTFVDAASESLQGLFGGVAVPLAGAAEPWAEGLVDYDGAGWNAGLRLNLQTRLGVTLGLRHLQTVTAGANLSVRL